MRLIGLILALGAITWVMMQVSGGGGEDKTAIPQGYQDSMKKASGVEATVMDAAQNKMDALEEEGY